jgi:hypothetical protein
LCSKLKAAGGNRIVRRNSYSPTCRMLLFAASGVLILKDHVKDLRVRAFCKTAADDATSENIFKHVIDREAACRKDHDRGDHGCQAAHTDPGNPTGVQGEVD